MKEDYVSYEVAKLLKEKGFDELCSSLYNIKTEEATPPREYVFNGDWSGYILRPTHQMAMKWLRDKHSFFIVIDGHFYAKDLVSHISSGFTYSYEIKHITTIHIEGGFETYEEACEKAIKYCLENLI